MASEHRWIWVGNVLAVIDAQHVRVQLDLGFRHYREIILRIVAPDNEMFSAHAGNKAILFAKSLFKPGDAVRVETFMQRSLWSGDVWNAAVWYEGSDEDFATQMEEAGHGTCGIPF